MARRTVTYATVDGRALRMDVYLPTKRPTEPTRGIVVIHGGGWTAGERGDASLASQWFADQGMTVFDVEYRTAPQPNWKTATGDVKCAVGWLKGHARAEWNVDPAASPCSVVRRGDIWPCWPPTPRHPRIRAALRRWRRCRGAPATTRGRVGGVVLRAHGSGVGIRPPRAPPRVRQQRDAAAVHRWSSRGAPPTCTPAIAYGAGDPTVAADPVDSRRP